MKGFLLLDPKWTLENLGKPISIEMISGPDRDRTDDLFHAIFKRSRNLLILDGLRCP
jgi:hypothetical protein